MVAQTVELNAHSGEIQLVKAGNIAPESLCGARFQLGMPQEGINPSGTIGHQLRGFSRSLLVQAEYILKYMLVHTVESADVSQMEI